MSCLQSKKRFNGINNHVTQTDKIKDSISGITQAIGYSLLLSHLSFIPYVHAGPSVDIHTIVSGAQSGTVSQSGSVTTINQFEALMAIDWDSYNLDRNEIVNYLQPNSSSISLNRIIGGSASEIHGQINANGQVVLVNPNGLFFGSTASVNVGGLIASGLDIDPVDFMNGDYVFKSVDGTTGAVINGGVLNASLGGSISLLGKQVSNEGLISANLGAVNLAAGHEAVLTFDNEGLMGVYITREILQDELGVDPAILNNGIITASSGRVLLTASQSQDIFSQAVNHEGIAQATSVVMHEDGSFSLGAGSDVVNTGVIDASVELNDIETNNIQLKADGSYQLNNDIALNRDGSYSVENSKAPVNSGEIHITGTSTNTNAGKVILLGENITHSGAIHANSNTTNGGEIELHSTTTTQLTGNAQVTARAEEQGQGGLIKLLGENVGLFDETKVDASGANGGGEVLIGGDKQGLNKQIRNADYIYLSGTSQVKTDALKAGNGGKLITFATDTARIYGDLYSRGGFESGNGGFIETSGLWGFEILKTPDISAVNGTHGEWLIDPHNISIVTGGGSSNIDTAISPFTSTADDATLGVNLITGALTGGATVTITTGTGGAVGTPADVGNIIFATTGIDYDGVGNATLILNAANNIETRGFDIIDSDTATGTDSLNIEFNADSDNSGVGNVIIANSDINTQGGTFTASGAGFTSTRTDTGNTIDTDGGAVSLDFTGAINIGSEIYTHGGDFDVLNATTFTNNNANGTIDVSPTSGTVGGSITIDTSGNITLGELVMGSSTTDTSGAINATTTAGDIFLQQELDIDWANDTSITLNAANNIQINALIRDSATGDLDIIDVTLNANQNLNGTGSIDINSNVDTNGGNFTANGVSFDSSGVTLDTSVGGTTINNRGDISITSTGLSGVVLGTTTTESGTNSGDLTISSTGGTITDSGNLTIQGKTILTAATNDITLNNSNNFVGNIRIISGNTITLNDTNGISLGDGAGVSTISGDLIVTAGGNVIDNGDLDITGATTISTTDDIILDGTSHDLKGLINLTTTGTDGLDIIQLNNTSTTTILGTVNSNGAMTVNAQGNLTIAGTVTTNNSSGNDTVTTDLNFGLDGLAGKVFNLNSGGSITTITANDETADVRIDGNNFGSTFNFNTGSNVTLDNGGSGSSSLFVNGGTAIDIFNVNIGLQATIDGAGNNDILNGADANNDWFVSSTANSGSLTSGGITTNFVSIERLNGNTGTNIDTITGPNDTVTWSLSGPGQGNLNNGSDLLGVGFFNMENITGGTGNDTYEFGTIGSISGVLDGSAGGNDIVNLDTQSAPVIVQVGTISTVTPDLFVVGVDEVNANPGHLNELIAENIENFWRITGINQGQLSPDDTFTTTLDFTGFGNITGNDQIDNFSFNTGGSISNVIDAAGSLNDVVNYSNLSGVSISLAGDAFNGVINAESIQGNSTLTLIGADENNTWTIDGVDDGNVSNITGTINFIDFSNLTGGSQNDRFNFESAGSITGVINGGDHATRDILDMNLVSSVDVRLGGGNTAGTDIIGIERVIGNITDSTITGEDLITNWDIDNPNGGTINSTPSADPSVEFIDFNNLVGGTGNDTFTLTGSGAIDTIDGGAGVGAFDIVDGNGIVGFDVTVYSIYTNIERFIGSGTNSTFTADASDNIWNITGANSGNIDSTIEFINFANLTGNIGDDDFVFFDGGSITGTIDGASQSIADTIDYSNTTSASVNLISYFANISNVEELYGNNTDSTLTGIDATSTWTVTNENDGNYTSGGSSVDFFNFNNLTGGNGDDAFDFGINGSITGLITGGGQATVTGDTVDMSSITSAIDITLGVDITGIEEITGNNTDSTLTGLLGASNFFNIDGDNDGIVSGLRFYDFNNLTGGGFNDTFYFSNNLANITGLIDGGTGGIDSISVGVAKTAFSITIGSGFVNIDRVFGNGIDSTLVGEDKTNNWTIGNISDGLNDGTIDSLEFYNFVNLTGGSGDDTFTFSSAGSMDGHIDGGAAGTDIVNYAAIPSTTPVIVNLDPTVANSILNIDSIIGNNTNSTINADNITNNWSITGNNDGNINGSLDFTDFNILNGGSAVDTFTVSAAGSIGSAVDPLGIINGNGNDDHLIMTIDNTSNGLIRFNGGVADTDTVSISGNSATGIYDSNVTGGYDRFTYTSTTNSIDIYYIESELVTDSISTTELTVNGTALDDVIEINNAAANNFTVGSALQVNYSGKDSIVFDGLSGSDQIDIINDITLIDTLELNAETVTNTNSSLITATTLVLSDDITAGDAVNPLETSVANLHLSNVTGNVYIEELNTVDIAELSTTGEFYLNVLNAGDVTDSTGLISNNIVDIRTTSGDILLDNSNQLSGSLTLIATGNNVTLTNGATTIESISANTFNLAASGPVTDTATSNINITGTTTINAAGQNIVLDNNGHIFTDLANISAANLTLVDSNAAGLSISNVTTDVNANISTSGNVQLGRITAGADAGVTTVGSISDDNGDSTNIQANRVILHAANGIGDGNEIETVSAIYNVVNSSSGTVEVFNTGVLTIEALKNLGSTGDITITNDDDFRINPGSIDAGYNTGELLMTTGTGSYLGLGPMPDFSNADITARAGTFFGFAGTFGTTARPLVLNIRDSALIQTRASLNPQFAEPRPVVTDESILQFSGLDTLSAIAGEQLVEVESLSEIDPAIFTDLRNYSMAETSIRMPRDQLFEDELEDLDRVAQ